jgi:hypothetical protein
MKVAHFFDAYATGISKGTTIHPKIDNSEPALEICACKCFMETKRAIRK